MMDRFDCPDDSHFYSLFKPIRVIGEGAQGRVMLVEHKTTSLIYAMKRLQGTPPGDAQEVNVLCRLSHPNITRLFGVWHSADSLNILMEYADGGSLADALKERATSGRLLDEDRVADWFVQIVSALAFMPSQS